MTKTILTCAVTGNLTKPEMTPHLPITAALVEAGSSVDAKNVLVLKQSTCPALLPHIAP